MDFPVEQLAYVEMFQQACDHCTRPFGFMEFFRERMLELGGTIYCPYCRSPHSYNESELDAEKRRHRETLARLNEAQLKTSMLEKRIGVGSCPCCKRNFKQLARHMKSKHPSYGK